MCDDDADGDGVPNASDLCRDSKPGAVVTQDGCSGEQLIDAAAPCEGVNGVPWKNHGKYVSGVAQAAQVMVDSGLITQDEKGNIMSDRSEAGCGKKN